VTTDLIPLLEAADRCGMCRSSAYTHAHAGTFPVPVIKVGGRYKVSRAAVERTLRRAEQEDGSGDGDPRDPGQSSSGPPP
jgi:predicted DNA-binding transcriptional regulator AlpA